MLSITDALQLMLLFGTLIINLIALVVELIKNHQQKKGSTLFGTDEFSSVPFLYMMTIKKGQLPQKIHTR